MTSIFFVEGKDTETPPMKAPLEYTPLRRFYAVVGFAVLVAAAGSMTVHGAYLIISDIFSLL